MKAATLAAVTATVALALTACSARQTTLPIGRLVDPGDNGTSQQEVRLPADAEVRGPARVARIVRFIERKYDLVDVWGINAQDDVVSYAVRMRLDQRSEHPDFVDWQAHVSEAVRDQRQASVEMLKRTVHRIPRAGLVSVFQDEFLQPHWSREQIRDMGRPESYREFEAWQALVLSAEYLPGFTRQ